MCNCLSGEKTACGLVCEALIDSSCVLCGYTGFQQPAGWMAGLLLGCVRWAGLACSLAGWSEMADCLGGWPGLSGTRCYPPPQESWPFFHSSQTVTVSSINISCQLFNCLGVTGIRHRIVLRKTFDRNLICYTF